MNGVQPKKIVYLLGAGATQAEVDALGSARLNLLMQDSEDLGEGLSRGIINRVGAAASAFDTDLGVDIEKLISLLDACGIQEGSNLAQDLRQEYFHEVRTRLVEARVVDKPALVVDLLRMHQQETFSRVVESLSGLITTNHDGLLQVASQSVFGGVNVGFQFVSNTFGSNSRLPSILQLHGSFTWRFGRPIRIERLMNDSAYSPDTVWIPPSILKESKVYPFNKLYGLAYELLARDCDVLRVIGASLTQNDWNILSLIFNAQQHIESTGGAAFLVELIMPHFAGEAVRRQCSYLKRVLPIGHLTEGNFQPYLDLEEDKKALGTDLDNPFEYWLTQKRLHHRNELGGGGAATALAGGTS